MDDDEHFVAPEAADCTGEHAYDTQIKFAREVDIAYEAISGASFLILYARLCSNLSFVLVTSV
jgi:hypothetical protein